MLLLTLTRLALATSLTAPSGAPPADTGTADATRPGLSAAQWERSRRSAWGAELLQHAPGEPEDRPHVGAGAEQRFLRAHPKELDTLKTAGMLAVLWLGAEWG